MDLSPDYLMLVSGKYKHHKHMIKRKQISWKIQFEILTKFRHKFQMRKKLFWNLMKEKYKNWKIFCYFTDQNHARMCSR